MLNAALLSRSFARLLRQGPLDLSGHAVERHEICPAEEAPRRPALHPTGAMDRILALSPWRHWDVERGLVEGTPVQHAATEALVVPDVVLAGSYLYRGAARERVGFGPARMLDPGLPPRQPIAEAHLVSNWTGADFFGHFVQDSLPLELVPPPGTSRVAAPTRPYVHEAGYRNLLDLAAPPLPGHAGIGRLTIYRDFSQNSHKRGRYDQLRARLRQRIGQTTPPAGIFLRRGSAHGTPRQLLNEPALIDFLAARGFAILDPERLTPDQIARAAMDAPIVVSVEGSHLGHAIYTLAAGGAYLVIQPPDRFSMPYKEIADCMEMRFGFIVGQPGEGGFTADLDEVDQMLERLA